MDRKLIIAQALSLITNELYKSQTDEQFCNLLGSYGLGDLVSDYLPYFSETQKNGDIIMFGDTRIKIEDIYGCLKSLGISKKRFEHIPYEEMTNYDLRNLEYNNTYRLILIGPMPHSVKGKGEYASGIEWLMNNNYIAKTIKMDNLKITKTTFKNAIKDEIDSGYLALG